MEWEDVLQKAGIHQHTVSRPKRQVIVDGPLFREIAYRWLPANSEIAACFLAMLVDVPPDFQGVEWVSIAGGDATIFEHQKQRTFPLPVDDTFLNGAFADKP